MRWPVLAERLMGRVSMEPFSGCWLWTGTLTDHGYGILENGHGAGKGAHVVSYELHVGKIPEGLELDHLCRVRCCVNPRHLEPVTHYENMRRGVAWTWR